MNKFNYVLAVSLMMLSFSALADVVIGKVDIQKVLLTVKDGQKVRDQLKKAFDDKKKVLDADQDKIKKMQEDFKKQSMVMNEKAKTKKEEEMQEAMMQIQQKSMAYQKEMQEMENKFKLPILEKIRDVINDVSKKSNVDVTFEASTAPVVYSKVEKDLTDDVIKSYDEKHK
jgi:outer membrane protein